MKNDILLPVAIIFSAIIISGAVLYSKSGTSGGRSTDSTSQQLSATTGDRQLGNQSKVSIDDDPVLGDKNALLTLVEFSDYECPFCKRSFDQLLPELKKNYIDTGKLKFVYRDFPLAFHANAHKEAEAAECARNQGNDETYFKFHDQIFKQTTSNGVGLALNQLPVIARSLGLNVNQFQQCLDSEKFKDEVDKDITDGTAAGVSGTPAWLIGRSSNDGVINGALVVGALPFSTFKVIIDNELNKLSK